MRAGPIWSISCAIPLALALEACSVATQPSVRRMAPAVLLPSELSLGSGLPDGSRQSEIQNKFKAQLASALAGHGVKVRDGAGFALTYATAIASADLGITQARGEAGQPIVWSEPARKHGMFDSCRPQRLRVVISGGSTAGAQQKLADGELVACKITDAESSSLANLLAAKLTVR